MQIKNYSGYIIIQDLSRDELNLDKTFDCGQTFRWDKTNDNMWIGVVENKIWALKQQGSTIATNMEYNAENIEKLTQYLNLDMNYTEEMSNIDLESDKYLASAYEAGKGIHILRQNLYEMIVTFIISQMNSMGNIRKCIQNISQMYGEEIESTLAGNTLKRYAFPQPEVLALTTSEKLRECKVGFRADYIINVSKYFVKNSRFLDELKEADYKTAIMKLTQFKGIGNKVANCICLFSLHHINAFPVDTHISQIIDKHYSGNIDISKFKGIAGIVQQYMFYYKALCKGD